MKAVPRGTRRKLRVSLVLLVLGCAAAAAYLVSRPSGVEAMAAPAERARTPVPSSYFGMTVNAIGLPRPWAPLDFSTVRLWGAIYWAQVNPAPGVYNWTRFDRILQDAEQRRLDVVFNLAYTPRWAAASRDALPAFSPGASSPPADLGVWEDWVRAAVTRAAGRIRYWEIWNEPEDPKYYSGDVETMVRLQQRAYEIIKSIDPTLIVLTPSSNGTAEGYRWQSAFLDKGGGRYADVFAFHGYVSDPEAVLPVIQRFKAMLAAQGLQGKPMWDTEAGWPLKDDNQAAYLARSYLMKWAVGVDRSYWYEIDGGGSDFGRLWDSASGLLASGVAFRTVRQWLDGARVQTLSRLGRSLWRLELTLPDGRSGQVVWSAAGSSTYQAGRNYRRRQDLDGRKSVIVDGRLEVGPRPVLLTESEPGEQQN
ncbi:hypothetical protein SSBR45G_16610 [Bradyrhizobium sp. SSBR45G]|uniref:glycosyl hydrolase n=1 Tax=unclassified Bradyrhizobium TaxID=2631580 RepID=UPI002342AD90|nr:MULTISPECIES: glycosyl hydrolase [unclassified Bradyrhizobium]GLH76753.1 hypothetical protein SSBR45G_16610 [Bradyrhizobium sp. SSBR45G]GLH83511.1 hypothetical protein SSBR45R_09710 [Bradyrhizobium sp. SSBR45R]